MNGPPAARPSSQSPERCLANRRELLPQFEVVIQEDCDGAGARWSELVELLMEVGRRQ